MNRNLVMPVILGVVFLSALVIAWKWDLWTKFAPLIFGGVGLLAVVIEIAVIIRRSRIKEAVNIPSQGPAFADTRYEDMEFGIGLRRAGWFFLWIFGLFIGIILFGFHITLPMFVLLYMKIEGKASWFLSIIIAVGLLTFLLLVFDWLLSVPWPEALLLNWLPWM